VLTPATSAKPFVEDEVIRFVAEEEEYVYCGDSYSCPSGSSCCPKPEGGYQCCSFSEASCCKDGVHCCPQGFTCDSERKVCTRKLEFLPMSVKKPARVLPPKNIKSNCKADKIHKTKQLKKDAPCVDGKGYKKYVIYIKYFCNTLKL